MIFENTKLQSACASIESLIERIHKGQIQHASLWQGADVVITSTPVIESQNSFYPGPRFVVTQYANSVSWIFESLKDVFITLEGYGAWKEEFFGRLANSANRQIAKKKDNTEVFLLLTLTHEALSILEEMQLNNFVFLPLGLGNEIYNDLIDHIETEGFLSIEETSSFFARKDYAE